MMSTRSASASASEPDPAKPGRFLADLLTLLPKSDAWDAWLERTKELPPDFDAMESMAYLPDPLRAISGKPVTKDTWMRRRQELLLLFQQFTLGTFPVSPGNVRVAANKAREESGAFVDRITLEFGPEYKAKLNLELLLPKGQGPFPVFLTSETQRPWALMALSRGYAACVYSADDSGDDTEQWKEIWPGLDWSQLARRAWAAARCIDHLHTLPFLDHYKVALVGHGVNAKVALIAAALDQRVNAVIVSSSGAGGVSPWRFYSEAYFGEGIEFVTRHSPEWFHPRLRFFAGRENKLPVDQSELVACIAPRSCLIASAPNDPSESLFAIEHSFASAHRVYEMLNKGHELNLVYRGGGHEARGEDVETYLDWLDTVFRRERYSFPDASIFPTYTQWQDVSGETIDLAGFPTNGLGGLLSGPRDTPIITSAEWLRKRDALRERILWGFGEAPAFAESRLTYRGAEPSYRAALLGRHDLPPGIQKQSFVFGNSIPGDLYFPTNVAGKKLPVVIWLHPLSVATGYVPAHRSGEPPHLTLARMGLVVLAYDQIGNGARATEVRNFYPRYPHWSLLGKQVEDALAAVEAAFQFEQIDSRQVYLLGYGQGGMVALQAAALDERVAGAVSVAGFTPMRSDTSEKGTGGLARWSGWMPWQPRLGAFIGRESQVPYDYHEVLAMIAPRPVMVFAPRVDYHATLSDVKKAVEEAGKVYQLFKAQRQLQLHELNAYNHFSPQTQSQVFRRLKALTEEK